MHYAAAAGYVLRVSDVTLVAKVHKRSHSIGLTIPAAIAAYLNFTEGTEVELEIAGRDGLLIRARRGPRPEGA